ncbi:UPF0280 family protein [uncultured Roseobacter sp.]|uniref:UPF0280 family protein n=1 Tax=uncultured Roseobacter sp. TaxID=114847 RepID=UPI002634CC1A|nr:UPF0280 family protein [uncultured Roseobacter sp.]
MGPKAHLLPDRQRLHLQHGPIDLIIGAEGQRRVAFEAAVARFETILDALVAELPALRAEMSPALAMPTGAVAQRMHRAALGVPGDVFFTRMVAVAGAVADEVLAAMVSQAELTRAFVNNGGDIALHLKGDAQFRLMMSDHTGRGLGRIVVRAGEGVGGIATSGRHGRSHSLGIADGVTVLAPCAAQADVAATLIANAVDLPGHPAIRRRPASALMEDSDLGARPVVVGCGPLTDAECVRALRAGRRVADDFTAAGLITDAALFLHAHADLTDGPRLAVADKEPAHA